ncbi:sugar ABC transporter permease [Clostridia bacterium]|nr:sugar ABC transporter permease [Clostridia bacterium]
MSNKKKRLGGLTGSTVFDLPFYRVLPYVLIPMLLYVFSCFIPVIGAVYYSLNNTFNFQFRFIGTGNYTALFKDPVFWLSLKNNLKIMMISACFQFVPAVIIACMMTTNLVRGKRFVQSMFFFPCVVSPIVITNVWKVMYTMRGGVINTFLTAIGLQALAQNWLADPKIIMTTIGIPLAWQFIGYYLVIVASAISNIDYSLLEIAMIDGATGFARTWHIILPLIRNTLVVALIICISGSIKIFDQVFAMTSGGPGYASSVLSMYAYNKSFVEGNFGYASAISVSMMLISFVMVILLNVSKKAVRNDE